MIHAVLDVLEDLVDLRIKMAAEEEANRDNRRWHEQIADKRREIEKRLQGALKGFVQYHST